MASVIPENLLTNKAIGRPHRRVGKALLVGLDDAATIWFEPPFEPADDRRLPDFVVLDPSLGVVVATVFGQSEGQEVLGALRGELRVVEAGAEVALANPLQLADSFVEQLGERLASDPALAMVPVAGLAAFPFLRREVAQELGFDSVIPLERCLFSNEIDALVRDDESVSLPRIIARALEGGVDDIIEDEVQARLRAVIHPEVVIGAPPEQGSLFVATPAGGTEAVRVMDLHQERFAKRMNPGHRVIRGVAGSGKTLILVTRARLMSRVNPAGQILVTCYNKSLASVLRSQLESCSNVKVATLDQLSSELIRSAGLEHPGYRGSTTPYAVALEAVARRPQHFRAVLVDEAQDFDDDALKLCVALTEPGPDGMGDLLVVADSAQRIYDRTFSWSAAGIQARGRTSVLRVNYRNTKEVLAFASAFVDADASADGPLLSVAARDEIDIDGETVVIPADATDRHGPAPEVHFVADVDGEVDKVLDMVEGWYSDRLSARSIAVLLQSGTDGDRAERLTASLRDRNLPAFWATESAQAKDRIGMTEDAVVVSTIHSAKGLEFPRVVMCGLTKRGSGESASRNRNTLYVGFTRAIDELAVVTTTDSPYAKAMRKAASGRSSS